MKAESIEEISAALLPLMHDLDAPWCIAGGWAIDLFLGRVTRAHADLEIAIYRQDQRQLRGHLSDWTFEKVVEGRLVNWPVEEELKLPVHEVHARSARESGLSLEFLLNERTASRWVYRRDARVRMPVENAIVRDKGALPLLAPEIVLLFKSKNHGAKDEMDFDHVRDVLGWQQRHWLEGALRICDREHPWLAQLHRTHTDECPAEPDLQSMG